MGIFQNQWPQLSLLASSILLASSVQAAGTVSGTVFHDYNGNGTQEITEPGVEGIVVTATDEQGNIETVTSTLNGSYTTASLAGNKARVEFTWPQDNSLNHFEPGKSGGTTVQFADISAGDANSINVALGIPLAYCEDNPQVATNCYLEGDQINGPNKDKDAIVAVPYLHNGDMDANTYLATAKQIGTTWGLAWQTKYQRLYAAAFLKRFAGLGPGTGTAGTDPSATIYQLDTNQTVTGVLDLSALTNTANIAGNALLGSNNGADRFELIGVEADFRDGYAYAAIGKRGFGDIDISADNNTLYAINLANRTLYAIDISSGNTADASVINEWLLPTSSLTNSNGTCDTAQVRPFGLKVWQNKVYIGSVCAGSLDSDLHAYVHSLDPSGTTFNLDLDFALSFTREPVGPGTEMGNSAMPATWNAWTDTYESNVTGWGGVEVGHPQPIFSDIEFTPNGDMILGFRDRYGEQVGYRTPPPFPADGDTLHTADSAGDILFACSTGAGSWEIENASANCSGHGAANSGPLGGAEYYEADAYLTTYFGAPERPGHHEISGGGLAQLRSAEDVILSGYDTLDDADANDGDGSFSGGLFRLSNTTGARTGSYRVFDKNATGTFGKANGLGDVELMCKTAPIEVGNRVWLDSNRNGLQDADENGIDGIDVVLTCGANNATVTTSNGGEYYFSNMPSGNATFMLSGESCKITIDNTQAALSTYQLTNIDADNISDNANKTDLRDSDADTNDTLAEVTFTVGTIGQNNHTFDFGYKEIIPEADLSLTKSIDKPTATYGETVVYTITVTNNGVDTATGIEVNEQLPTGLSYASDLPTQGTYNSGTGIWTVGDLANAATATLAVTATVVLPANN